MSEWFWKMALYKHVHTKVHQYTYIHTQACTHSCTCEHIHMRILCRYKHVCTVGISGMSQCAQAGRQPSVMQPGTHTHSWEGIEGHGEEASGEVSTGSEQNLTGKVCIHGHASHCHTDLAGLWVGVSREATEPSPSDQAVNYSAPPNTGCPLIQSAPNASSSALDFLVK